MDEKGTQIRCRKREKKGEKEREKRGGEEKKKDLYLESYKVPSSHTKAAYEITLGFANGRT